jgi:hypothetical protein
VRQELERFFASVGENTHMIDHVQLEPFPHQPSLLMALYASCEGPLARTHGGSGVVFVPDKCDMGQTIVGAQAVAQFCEAINYPAESAKATLRRVGEFAIQEDMDVGGLPAIMFAGLCLFLWHSGAFPNDDDHGLLAVWPKAH